MKKTAEMIALGLLAFSLLLSACGTEDKSGRSDSGETAGTAEISQSPAREDLDFSLSYEGIETGRYVSGANVHDPSVIQDGGQFYIFGSHMATAKSEDLRMWRSIGSGYQAKNPVYGNIFKQGLGIFDYAGSKNSVIPTDDGGWHVWAPDVVFNKKMQKYLMYVSISSTWNASNIALMSSDTIEGPYVYEKALIYSGFADRTIDETNVLDFVSEDYAAAHYYSPGGYRFKDNPNAIDPTVFYDKEGLMWMVYGSWSGGIFLLEIDEATGDVIHPEADEEKRIDPYFGKKLLGGGHHSMEGPYIMYHPESDYYYLFVSYGELFRTGGYQMRVFRSKTVDGDYVDMNGKFPLKNDAHALFGLKLSGNYSLPSLPMAYMATGHNSAVIDARDGKFYNVFHTRFDNNGENHQVRCHQMALNEEGWPVMLPYNTRQEEISGELPEEAVPGRYYFLDQGLKINAEIAEPSVLYLTADGRAVSEKEEGSWERKAGTPYLTLSLGGKNYSGVLCRMQDEAGTEVTVFSLAGDNHSLWGVKYE